MIEKGSKVQNLEVGQKVGIPWLGKCCNECEYCKLGKENLCDNAEYSSMLQSIWFHRYTGYQRNGGLCEYCVADSEFCFPIPHEYSDVQVYFTCRRKNYGIRQLHCYVLVWLAIERYRRSPRPPKRLDFMALVPPLTFWPKYDNAFVKFMNIGLQLSASGSLCLHSRWRQEEARICIVIGYSP